MNIRTMLSIVLSLFVAISLTFISWRSYDIYLENNEDSWVRRTNELSDALIVNDHHYGAIPGSP